MPIRFDLAPHYSSGKRRYVCVSEFTRYEMHPAFIVSYGMHVMFI